MPSSPIYQAVPIQENEPQARTSRSLLATVMLTICVVSFVLQTELAQYVQRTTNYQKPYFILWVGHCGYIFMGVLQLVAECIARRHMPHKNIVHLIRLTIKECKQEVIESAASLEPRPRRWIYRIIAITILLTLPAYLWFVSVNLTTMSTLTAIYNTGCFFAYLFSIIILGDPIMRSKVMAVLLCIIGVGIMAFWADDNDNDNGDDKSGIMGLLGILVATTCAATYGFYEVFYKKIASPPQPSVLFANVVTTGIGLATLLLLWIPIPLLHWTGYETFQMPDPATFGYILCVGSMSVIYNATFMCVISLANPVFAAVGVMLTVPAVAIVDVLVTGVMIPTATIVGSILILVGFYILNRDMKENNDDDQ